MIPLIMMMLLPISYTVSTSSITIVGPNKFTFSYKNNLTESILYHRFKIPSRHLIEDYYFDSKLVFNYPHISNHYLYLVDKENNVTKYPFTLNIIDDISPSIKGPSLIEYDYELLPSTTDLLKNYTCYDEIDLMLPINIDKNIEDVVYKPGNYTFTLSSKDYSSNTITKLISLNVTSNKKEPFHINEHMVKTNINNYISPEKLIKILIEKNLLENKDYLNYRYILDDYTSNYHKEGVYSATLQIIDDFHIIEIKIKFINEKEILNKTSLIDILINFFKNFISWLKKLIANII